MDSGETHHLPHSLMHQRLQGLRMRLISLHAVHTAFLVLVVLQLLLLPSSHLPACCLPQCLVIGQEVT